MHTVKPDIFWTGHVDWDIRNFHGYSTPSGTTYNSYLILDEKPTLIDTVKSCGFDEMLSHIKEVIDPSKIRYIISNHTEMDHSGSIDRLLQHCPDAEVVCSPNGAKGLRRHFKKDWKLKVVDSGETLDIGKRKLAFFLVPMVHWPDSMVTYSESDGILFSNDAFGQHYASSERFVDEIGLDIICRDAAKYYGNIVMPHGTHVLKALDAVATLTFDMICPSHGLIWRRKEDIAAIAGLYKKWASHETDDKAVIVYDSMWHSTEAMATRLYDLIDRENIPVKLMNLQHTHISDVVAEVLVSKLMLIGSPVLNNRVLPTIAGLLMYLKGLNPKNRYAMTFGSYGWAKIAFKELEQSLKDAGFELAGEGRYIQYIPDEAELNNLSDLLPIIKEVLR